MEAKTYAIKGWHRVWENAASRKLKALDYVALTTDQESLVFREFMHTTDGAAIFGHFIALAQLAGKCPRRGVLYRSGRALAPESCALLLGVPPDLMAKSWSKLIEVGWLVESSADDPPRIRHESPDNLPSSAAHPPKISHTTHTDTHTSPTHTHTYPTHPEGDSNRIELVTSDGQATGRFDPRVQQAKDAARAVGAAGDVGPHGKLQLASFIGGLKFGTRKVFKPEQARSVLELPGLTLAVAEEKWETLNRQARRNPIDNPGGYFRRMLEEACGIVGK